MRKAARILAAAALLGVAVPTPARADPARAGNDLRSLPPGPRPVPVAVGAYLIDVERIEEGSGTCSINAYLDLQWRDARLAVQASPPIDRNRVSLDDIWWPDIEFYNQYEQRDTANVHLVLSDDGTVRYEERYRVKLGCDLDFRRFPFDSQHLPMQIESFRYDARQVALTIRPRRELVSRRAFLPDWFILGATESVGTDESNPDREPYSLYTFAITVRRKSASYLWNIFAPLIFITALSWVVFWIGNKDFTNIGITTLVAAVAFAFVVSASRPRQSYMTFMDGFVLASYAIIFLANILSVAVHYLDRHGRAAASAALARTCRWAFPLAYLFVIALVSLLWLVPAAVAG